ncbi:MAG: hypothetical protein CME71_12190 [Halobacteriovorax sp.]|nr:hypothetical protein [Halobacteriovorax sp.]|tara:strand:+ start:101 stop:556 length:456 start_codon:yes stop_codon:yes gene_type:complete
MPENSLFLSALLSGTVLPGSSEAVLLYWLSKGEPMWQLVLIATIGNSLGGLTAYYLGVLGEVGKIEKYVGLKQEKMKIYKERANRFGSLCAFFGFLPFVGDFLIVALGLCGVSAFKVFPLMMLGKMLRYLVVAAFLPEVEWLTRSIFDFLT